MVDDVVSGDIRLEGVPEAIRELELVKARIDDISKSTAKVTIDQSGLQSAEDHISTLATNIERINAKVAQGTALTVNDIKSIAIELQSAYNQLAAFAGRSNEATAAAERSLAAVGPIADKILAGNTAVEASSAALASAGQARLDKFLADVQARAQANDALKANTLSNNAAQIASNDALAASFDRVAVATNGASSASTRQARTLGPDQPIVDYRSTQRYRDQVANQRADEDRAYQVLPTDDARVIQRKQQAAHEAQLMRVREDSEKRLEGSPAAKPIQTRAQIQQEQQRVAAEFDAAQADRDVRSQYYQISQPVQAPYVARYRASQPANKTQEVEAQFQAMLQQPIDPKITGAPNINAAINQRSTEANRWRSAQMAAIKEQSAKDLDYIQKAATLTGLRNDQAVSDSYVERGYTNIAVGGDPIVPITQESATRRNRAVRNPALGGSAPASAALGGNRFSGGSGVPGRSQGRMPVRGSAANRYGRSFAPPIIPQAELDANFEAEMLANPPPRAGELTPRQIHEAQQAIDAAKAQPAILDANRQAIEDRIKAYGQQQGGYNPFDTNASGKPLLNPAANAAATAEEAKNETKVISEEAGKQWEVRRQFLDKELADSKATWQAAAAERDKLATASSQMSARVTTLNRRAESPNATYGDARAASAAQSDLNTLREQLRNAQEETRNAKAAYEEVSRSTRQQNRQDSFSADAMSGGPTNGASGGGGGGRQRARSTQSIRIVASSADDAETQIRNFQDAANNLRANGGRIVLNIEASGGFETEGELRRIANAAHQITGPEGKATVHLSAEGGSQTLAQMEAVAKFNQDPNFTNINFQADTSGMPAANRLAKESQAANRAAREEAMANAFADREAAAIQKQSLIEEAQYIDDIKFKHKEAATAAKEQAAATAEISKAAKEAKAVSDAEDANRTRPFTQTANTQSRSILGVPAALAAPIALGAGIGLAIKDQVDYNSLLIKTANQTNLTSAEIDKMNASIRDTPSGSSDLTDLATGFKNITDLGYGAADAQGIMAEESKAATAAGSDQATVMLAITSSMKDYNAEASDVAKFTNTTVEAARLANSTFENWSDTTRRATAIAAAYKVPLAEVDAMLVALTRHGFNTAQANTQVAGLIQNIVAPTPTAQREIKSLSQRTGIDLVGDFSQQGLAAKTMAGVLDDLARATDGDEAEIRKLIPALRGGQAALLLTTNASDDFRLSLGLLQSTVDGSLKPVDDGFNRISHTIGYQAGTALKDFKFDMIDIGQGFAPIVSNLLEVINKMPPALQQSVIAMTLVSLAAKAMAIGLDFVQASAAKYVASEAAMASAAAAANKATAEGTAVTLADNEALIANTELVNLNALSLKNRRMVQGLSPVGATGGAEAVAVDAAEVGVAAGFGARIIGAVGTAAAALGTIVVPVTIGVAVGKVIADTVDPTLLRLLDSVIGKDTPAQRAAKNPDVQTADQYAQEVSSTPDAQEAIRVGKLYLDQVDQEITDYKSHKKNTLNPFDSTNDEIDSTVNALVDRQKKIQVAVDNRLAGLDPTARKKAEMTPDEQAQAAQAAADQAASDTQNYQLLEQKRNELLAKGAPERLVNVALYSDDFSDLTTEQVDQAKKDLTEWERQYNEVQTAAKAAQTALQSIDLSKGLSGLTGDADKLKVVNDGLTKIGQGQSNLSGLTSISGAFKDIQDAEDLARTAYDGFLLTLDETDRRVSVLQSLRQKVTDAVTAAQAASDRGAATDQDRELLQKAPDIFGNIDKNIADLKTSEVPDILGLATNLPKYKEFDDLTRSTVARFGGGTVLEATLHTDVTDAKSAIQAVVDGPWNAYINVHANTNGTNTPPPFNPGSPATSSFDNTNGNGNGPVNPGGDSTPSYVPGNGQYTPAGGPTFNQYRPLSPQQYAEIVHGVTGGKQSYFDTPEAYTGLVTAAQLQNVDPRALLAFAKYESADGTTSSETQNANLNFSGIKFANQSGATRAEAVTDGTGGNYARFDTLYDYFTAFAKNLSTGDYANDYRNGDLYSVGKRYVGQSSDPAIRAQQDQSINDRNSEYYRYLTQYPADPGATGGPGHADYPDGMDPEQLARNGQPGAQQKQWMLPVDNYTITQGPFSPFSHSNLGAYDLAVPNGTPVRSVAAGTVVESGYSDAGYGNSEVIDYGQGIRARYGHLSDLEGVKVGQQVGAGQEIGLSGSTGNSTGPHLHFEVTVNGKETDPKSIGFNFEDPAHQGVIPDGVGVPNPGTQNTTNPADPRFKVIPMYNATDQARMLAANMARLNPQDQSRLESIQSSFGAYAKQNYEAKPEYFGNKTAADNAAENATLNFAIVYSRTLGDIRNHTGNIAQDYRDLQKTGGALADNAVQWLKAQVKIDQATQNIQDAQDKIKAIDDAAFSRNISRTQDDQIIAAKALNQSRGQENADIALANKNRDRDRKIQDQRVIDQNNFDATQRQITLDTNTSNDNYTPVQRKLEDRARALQFSQQVGNTDLQNQIDDVQKRQTNTTYQRTSAEQLVSKQAAAAPTNTIAGTFAGQLSLMHDADLARRDADKKELDDLQQKSRDQAKADSLDSYNLQTETIAAQRAHEDDLHNIDIRSRKLANAEQDYAKTTAADDLKRQRGDEDAAVRLAASRLQIKRDDEDAAIRLADKRTAQDQADAIDKKNLQDTIDQNTKLQKSLTDYQGQLDGVAKTWSDIATSAGATADPIVKILVAAGQASGNPVDLPTTQNGNAYSRRFGTHAAGIPRIPDSEFFSVVGDGPGGQILPSTEVIHAPGLAVTNLRQLFATPPPTPSSTGSGGNIFQMPITLNDNGNDEELIAQLHREYDAKLRLAIAQMRNNQRSLKHSRGVG